jgi:hypothetical protein
MPSGLSKLVELLDLSTPLAVAIAVYGIFHFLEKRTSKEAKAALTAWLHQPPHFGSREVADFVLEAFDRLFTRPLLGWRAVGRSAAWTVVVSAIVLWELLPIDYLRAWEFWAIKFGPQLAANLVSDYLSLFIVRKWLQVAGSRPLVALLGAPVFGAVIVFLANSVIHVLLTYLFFTNLNLIESTVQVFNYWTKHIGFLGWRIELASLLTGMAIHFWLLFFAMGLILNRLVWWILWLSGRTQWFWERGKERPFDAVGWVVAPIVFGFGCIFHYLY